MYVQYQFTENDTNILLSAKCGRGWEGGSEGVRLTGGGTGGRVSRFITRKDVEMDVTGHESFWQGCARTRMTYESEANYARGRGNRGCSCY